MTQLQLAAEVILGNIEVVKRTLADFSDQDMMVRPCPGANHAAWQLAHLCHSCMGMCRALPSAAQPGALPELPPAIAKIEHQTTSNDDPAFFGPKAPLMECFITVHQAAARLVREMPLADLEKPAPERMRGIAPTLGHLLNMLTMHIGMHVGQFQVIRRKLGKPVLF